MSATMTRLARMHREHLKQSRVRKLPTQRAQPFSSTAALHLAHSRASKSRLTRLTGFEKAAYTNEVWQDSSSFQAMHFVRQHCGRLTSSKIFK
eukprot:4093804-Amphidinium_carterae.1